jgi:hypothetical protein
VKMRSQQATLGIPTITIDAGKRTTIPRLPLWWPQPSVRCVFEQDFATCNTLAHSWQFATETTNAQIVVNGPDHCFRAQWYPLSQEPQGGALVSVQVKQQPQAMYMPYGVGSLNEKTETVVVAVVHNRYHAKRSGEMTPYCPRPLSQYNIS